MSFDTTNINRNRQNLDDFKEIWVFGYGSLIYKVDFPFIEKRPAYIRGWQRRFWQGSHDHRGTPESPGRVVTLIEEESAECSGMAYRVDKSVFEHLDHREKNGYLRHQVCIHFFDIDSNLALGDGMKNGLVYIGAHDSEAYLGEDSEENIAIQISQSAGPSGRNDEYVYQLADGLRTLGEVDEHVFAIEKHLIQMAKRAEKKVVK